MRFTTLIPLLLVLFCTTAGHGELDSDTLAANRALDQAFLDAHAQKSTDALLSLFSTRPDVVFIAPNGTVNHGRDEIRGSFSRFFALLEEIHGEITTVQYFRVGDAVAATGTEVSTQSPAGGDVSDLLPLRSSDLRQRVGVGLSVDPAGPRLDTPGAPDDDNRHGQVRPTTQLQPPVGRIYPEGVT